VQGGRQGEVLSKLRVLLASDSPDDLGSDGIAVRYNRVMKVQLLGSITQIMMMSTTMINNHLYAARKIVPAAHADHDVAISRCFPAHPDDSWTTPRAPHRTRNSFSAISSPFSGRRARWRAWLLHGTGEPPSPWAHSRLRVKSSGIRIPRLVQSVQSVPCVAIFRPLFKHGPCTPRQCAQC
jgi:hypothetical protein